MNPNIIPQIKPHYRVEIIEPKQVYLLSEQTSHALTGQLYCQILPLLNGQNTLEDITQTLDGQVPREYINYVLNRLAEKGYLTEVAPDLSPEVAAFWSEMGVAPTIAAQGVQQQISLNIVGDSISDMTTAALAKALRDIGITVQSPQKNGHAELNSALKVMLTDDYLQPQLAEINKQAQATRQPWLLIKPIGSILWLGPIFVPGLTGCWNCLAHRLRGNREIEASVLRQRHKQTKTNGTVNGIANDATNSIVQTSDRLDIDGCLPTARGTLPSTLQMGLQLAATEIAKWLVKRHSTGILKECSDEIITHPILPTLEAKIITFNQTTLDLQTHLLPHRPQCPCCGNPNLLRERGFQSLDLQSRPKHFTSDGGHRAVTPSQTIKTYQHLISPISGVVTELVRISDPANPLVHTYRAGHSFGSATSLRGLRHALRHKSSGKGKTDQQSKVSGFCEAVERYSGIYQGDEPKIQASLVELGSQAIHPEHCLHFSNRQYDNRETLNKQNTVAHDWIPQRFDTHQTIDWTPVWSLTEQTYKYLPTALCYYDYPLPKEHRFCGADSNGNAAGNTLEEAILQGFMELVERDSVALWWYNRLQRPAVDLASFCEPYFLELQQLYRHNDRDIWVLDLTADLGIPVFAAVSCRTDSDTQRIIAGFGAHLDSKIAILRAMTEVNQLGLELDKVPVDQLEGDWKDWMLNAKIENQPYLIPDPSQPRKTASDYSQQWSNDIYTDVMTCVQIAQAAGLETLVLDQTRPDIGLSVVKVIIPEMRHFWSRFGLGRLYDVPVKLGWQETPLSEEQMNPIPMPF
ncbi:TOMM precursor leader peptide-binding protein [Calothrix sp. FACHB-156]|nr:TOMM precursor leader peptide-binding protein [Calothrix sp. FACHB-156]